MDGIGPSTVQQCREYELEQSICWLLFEGGGIIIGGGPGFARRFKLSDFAHFHPNTDPVVGLGPSSTQTLDAENMRWS